MPTYFSWPAAQRIPIHTCTITQGVGPHDYYYRAQLPVMASYTGLRWFFRMYKDPYPRAVMPQFYVSAMFPFLLDRRRPGVAQLLLHAEFSAAAAWFGLSFHRSISNRMPHSSFGHVSGMRERCANVVDTCPTRAPSPPEKLWPVDSQAVAGGQPGCGRWTARLWLVDSQALVGG